MMQRYRVEQVISISGFECGTEIELKMVVIFRVFPGSEQTSVDPAEEPSVEVNTIRFFDGNDEIHLPWSIGDRFTSADGFKEWLMGEAADQRQNAIEDAADARREMMMEELI